MSGANDRTQSEEDVRGGLLAAVADEPPLRFDPDELVGTARRQGRRRALVAAGFATAVVAVAAVAVPVALGRGTATTPVADRPTSASSPSTVPPPTVQWPPPGVETAHYTVDDLRKRGQEMREHLRGTLPAVLRSASGFTYGEFGGEASGEFYEGQTGINAATSFTVDGARYSIMITSWVQGGETAPPEEICVSTCRRLDDRAGGALYTQTEPAGDGVIQSVYHFRDTGAVVSVAAYNYDMTGVAPPSYQPAIPLTLDQLCKLATDPQLEL